MQKFPQILIKLSIVITIVADLVSGIDRERILIPEERLEEKVTKNNSKNKNKRNLWAANIFANVSDPCDYISNDYPYVVRRTCNPTSAPTFRPTRKPTKYPTNRPTRKPSSIPSTMPSITPTGTPTTHPSKSPSLSSKPTDTPTQIPSASLNPSVSPSLSPTAKPSYIESLAPSTSHMPSGAPTGVCGLTPTQRIEGITQVISTISSADDLSNPNTTQYKSLQWILYDDNKYLCPNNESLVQRYVVTVFYYSMNGNDWNDCSYNSTSCMDNAVFKEQRSNFLSDSDECEWGGLECNKKQCVIAIMKQNQQMSGTIPSELGYLSCLRILDMDDNNIFGTIPDMFASLKNLRTIDIDTNQIEGKIPPSLLGLQNLVVLDMNDNQFTGTLPTQKIANLKSLEFFQIDNNHFTGTFPSTLGQLKNLHVFTATGLDMVGSMPDEVCELLTVNGGELMHLWTDCGGLPVPEVTCECCTQCASDQI